VEETVPAPLIALDLNQTPDAVALPFGGTPPSELLAILRVIYQALRRDGLSDHDARARLLLMEPFADHPEIVAGLDEGDVG
jgi:enoyl-CoA hydratase/carnithine racemase